MANSTPMDLRARGYGINSGVVTTLYPHSQIVNSAPVKTVSAVYSAADATIAKGAAVANDDIFNLIDIPAGALVLSVAHKVVTQAGGACTYSIGDSGSVNNFVVVATGNGNAATNTQSFDAVATLATNGVGKFYAAADYIKIQMKTGAALTPTVIKVSVTYIQTAPFGS
jgi:hypothetical protein